MHIAAKSWYFVGLPAGEWTGRGLARSGVAGHRDVGVFFGP